jgi:hypothetical protein
VRLSGVKVIGTRTFVTVPGLTCYRRNALIVASSRIELPVLWVMTTLLTAPVDELTVNWAQLFIVYR